MKGPPCIGLVKWFHARAKRQRGHRQDCACGPCVRTLDVPSLAALTGQDARALSAFVHMLELYALSDANGRECAIVGMRAAAAAMQPQCRVIAKGSIPFVLDWGDEARVWAWILDEKPGFPDART